jgi:hypothetical protein
MSFFGDSAPSAEAQLGHRTGRTQLEGVWLGSSPRPPERSVADAAQGELAVCTDTPGERLACSGPRASRRRSLPLLAHPRGHERFDDIARPRRGQGPRPPSRAADVRILGPLSARGVPSTDPAPARAPRCVWGWCRSSRRRSRHRASRGQGHGRRALLVCRRHRRPCIAAKHELAQPSAD